jgi:hypothetical protein
MRSYSVVVASLSANAPAKWTDNLLSQHAIPEVPSRQRGVARGIPWRGLVRIATIRQLHVRLGCGVREAVSLADKLLASSEGAIDLGGGISVAIDQVALEHTLRQRLTEALETAPQPRRGRPLQRATPAR